VSRQLAPERADTSTDGQRIAYLVGHGTGMDRVEDLVCEDESDAAGAVLTYDAEHHPHAMDAAWYEPIPFVPAR
jgi:hypothetical protein